MFLNTLLLIILFLVITDLQLAMQDITTTKVKLDATKADVDLISVKLAAVETDQKKINPLRVTTGIIITINTATTAATDTAIMAMSICFLVGVVL